MAASTYATIQGDLWDAIAYRLWGNEKLFHKLMEANPQHRHVVIFPANVILAVPQLTTELTATAMDPPWK
ncbi:tail protein X [Solidesulfovibrio sp.]